MLINVMVAGRKRTQADDTAVCGKPLGDRDAEKFCGGRPLAGTRRRGRTQAEDAALEKELLADDKECSEHVMLVDLGRNDVGKASPSSFVSGVISRRQNVTCPCTWSPQWDAQARVFGLSAWS